VRIRRGTGGKGKVGCFQGGKTLRENPRYTRLNKSQCFSGDSITNKGTKNAKEKGGKQTWALVRLDNEMRLNKVEFKNSPTGGKGRKNGCCGGDVGRSPK